MVTPSHQSPTGVALTLQRRVELLDRAGEQGAWIIEDSLTAWRHGAPGRRGLMMGFTNLRSQSEADRLVAELMRALKA